MWSKLTNFCRSYWRSFLVVGGIAAFVGLGVIYQIDAKILALMALIAGFVTNGFAALATLTALIPIVGPIIVKLFSMPLFYLLNALGHFLSLAAIKKGYRIEVVSYRVLAVILMVGVVAGYILGNILPL